MTTALEYYSPVETHLISSKHVGQAFKVQVMLPVRKRGETTRFPVVYATDGNMTFDMFKGISQVIQTSAPDGLRYILVGIGYDSDSPRAGSFLRGRDLTFPGYAKIGRVAPAAEGVVMNLPGTKDFLGAEDFQQFIANELIPLIDEKYPTVVGDRTYFGHSAGGGFGLYTLFYRTELFKRYIISSPGLSFHGRTLAGVDYDQYDFVFEDARKFIASGKSLEGIKMYLSVGTEEEFEPGVEPWRLTSTFYRFARLMKAAEIPGLDLMTETFPGENHSTVWPLAFLHGVQAVLRKRGP